METEGPEKKGDSSLRGNPVIKREGWVAVFGGGDPVCIKVKLGTRCWRKDQGGQADFFRPWWEKAPPNKTFSFAKEGTL